MTIREDIIRGFAMPEALLDDPIWAQHGISLETILTRLQAVKFFTAPFTQLWELVCLMGETEAINALAHPPYRIDLPTVRGILEFTPLHMAALGGNTAAVSLLIDTFGLEPSVTNAWGNTALHFAAKSGVIDTHLCLLQRGLKNETTNHHGENTLHWAASSQGI